MKHQIRETLKSAVMYIKATSQVLLIFLAISSWFVLWPFLFMKGWLALILWLAWILGTGEIVLIQVGKHIT